MNADFHDALNETDDVDLLIKNRPTGVDIAATQANFPVLLAQVQMAPNVFSGTRPSKSPNIRRFCPGGRDNQVIGMCVGKGGRNGAGTVVRIPANATADSKPLPTQRFSGLFNYWNARAVSRAQGINLGGEGAIVAHLMVAMQNYGVVPEDWMDESDAAQQRYSDRSRPSSQKGDIYAKGLEHQLLVAARIGSRDQALDFLGNGYPIVIGKPIGQSYMQTAADGRFSLGGRTVGGHCTLFVDYDETTNQAWERNSWAGWGARTDDPEFADAGGRNNLGYTALDEYLDRHFSERALRSGETDAFVINTIEGFEKPKIVVRPIKDLL